MSEAMQRSRTQVLFSNLPESVYMHQSGVVVRTTRVEGRSGDTINRRVVLSEIEAYLSAWSDEDRLGLELPSRLPESAYQFITPELVYWQLWPLVFECSRGDCGRLVSFQREQDVARSPRCATCGGRLRQLRYLSAHDCTRAVPMFLPPCPDGHGYEDLVFDDTGSFLSSVFRCRGTGCNGRVVRRTAQSPCSCQSAGQERAMMRAHTVRDTRVWHPHSVNLINFRSESFRRLQESPYRGAIAIASYIGVLGPNGNLAPAVAEADQAGDAPSQRSSPEAWASREIELRGIGLTEDEIAAIRARLGPPATGLAALPDIGDAVVELGASRPVVERAAVYDRDELARISLGETRQRLVERGEAGAADVVSEALTMSERLGLEEVAITWSFPVALAAFGYTRETKVRGEGKIRSFARRGEYDGATPVFTATSETEAALVTLRATRVVAWLQRSGLVSTSTTTSEAEARGQILGLFADEASNPSPPHAVRSLIHTMSHTLLRSLDDAAVGLSESALAEWVVPETLTFALYVASFRSYTLGSLWTLLNSRCLEWLETAHDASLICENDPICHQSSPRACERCLFVAFGCPRFNADLDRSVLRSFWSAS